MLMSSGDSAAQLIYGPNGFRVMRPGEFVLCAVTAHQIPLEELRYWSVDLQEPYASAEIATKRALEAS
jgi:hypothetical protein